MQRVLTPLPQTSKVVKDKLASLTIYTYWDLLLHVPLRYEDLTSVYPIANAHVGSQVLIEGEIISCEMMHKRTRQLQVKIKDETQCITLIFFHFYPNYANQYKVGKIIRAFGEIKADFWGNKTIIHPKIQTVSETLELPNTFSPIYSTTNGLSQAQIVKLVEAALVEVVIPETIPDPILEQDNLLSFARAITILHKLTPQQFKQNIHQDALKRIKIDELLAQQLILYNVYQQKHSNSSIGLKTNGSYTKLLLQNLPFQLTKAQIKVLNEIYTDLAKPTQMARLLQGDVGSGKTIIATLTMLAAIENGYQACIMAPTEILAEQHYLTTKQLLASIGINVIWLTGSLTRLEKRTVYADIEAGTAQIIIGTHAVFQKDVVFNNLAVVVVDEQHRFGVSQRLALQNKGRNPHQLMMSATPIPRSLAMSYYADLDISIIDELPPGRTPIKTLLINNNRREEVINFISEGCKDQRQVYWVCPLIEESEKLELESAVNTFQELAAKLAPIKVGLVHGKLKSSEKAAVMQEFAQNRLQVLVATTVIEVGVDIPNASIMVIEHSERMG
ncbi:MAG: ATP-dependent DNA helicase RecG, partial [Burkholderiales bacterium]